MFVHAFGTLTVWMTALFADSSLVFPWQLIDKGDWLKLSYDFQVIVFSHSKTQCWSSAIFSIKVRTGNMYTIFWFTHFKHLAVRLCLTHSLSGWFLLNGHFIKIPCIWFYLSLEWTKEWIFWSIHICSLCFYCTGIQYFEDYMLYFSFSPIAPLHIYLSLSLSLSQIAYLLQGWSHIISIMTDDCSNSCTALT